MFHVEMWTETGLSKYSETRFKILYFLIASTFRMFQSVSCRNVGCGKNYRNQNEIKPFDI